MNKTDLRALVRQEIVSGRLLRRLPRGPGIQSVGVGKDGKRKALTAVRLRREGNSLRLMLAEGSGGSADATT